MSNRSTGARAALFAASLAILAPGIAFAGQPKMEKALAALQAARNKLANAEEDKAGHREAALRLVDQALAEVREGIAAGAGH
jgi:hypothetical protein